MLRSFSANKSEPECLSVSSEPRLNSNSAQKPPSDKHTERTKFLTFLIINSFVFASVFTLLSASSIAQDGTKKNAGEAASGEPAPATGADGKPVAAFNKPYGYYLNPMLDHIQADPDQRAKITVILQNYRGRLEPLRNEYNAKRQEFLTNVVKGVSSDVIMAQQIKIGHLYEEITSHYCQMSLEVRRLLKDDQIVRYEEFKRQRGWTRKSK
ncbi:MAG: hypothetical protein K2X77_12745 [Candidatus Obscuribacterales bacterium]|nr:hypothetical protein [Candidatus Obscuribacterales bacterium]